MPCLLGLIALIAPRLIIVLLWLLSDWFNTVFDNILILLAGFIFAPAVTLWYSVVVNYYHGEWNSVSLIGMVVAVLIDFGGVSSSRRRGDRRGWW